MSLRFDPFEPQYTLGTQFVLQLAAQLPDHDDREQYLAGIDLILLGITAVATLGG